MSKIITCSRCIYTSDIPNITFNSNGSCSFCEIHDQLEKEYPVGVNSQNKLNSLFKEIKSEGRKKNKRYDCVVGISGGCDSSYLLYKAVSMGLKPLAVHFDNTWNSPIATMNINRMIKKLDVDLFTIVVNNKEYDDIYRSFMLSGVKDIESPTDIALLTTMYRACNKYKIKYLLEGHSFRTEGISHLSWLYMDGKYISSIHKRFGSIPMKTYPNLTLSKSFSIQFLIKSKE